MEIKIVSPNKINQYKNAKKILIPTKNGYIEVLKNHSETFTLTSKGKALIETQKNKSIEINLEDGICFVKDNKILIIL